MFCKSTLLSLASLVAVVLADVSITWPTETAAMTGGFPYNVTWLDDNKGTYDMADFGLSQFSIAIGDSTEQIILQVIGTDIDVSTTQMFEFTLDPSIGPDGADYFIRVDSNNLSRSNGYKEQAFSSKYSLDGMTGTLDAKAAALLADSKDEETNTATTTATPTRRVYTTRTTTAVPTVSISVDAESANASVDTDGAAGLRPDFWIAGLVVSFGMVFFA